MAETIILVNKRTNHVKNINVGIDWSWSLFLSPLLLCIPLLTRQLYEWAMLMMIFFLINTSLIYALIFVTQSWIIFVVLPFPIFIMLISQIFLANKGNNMAFTRHLENGWVVYEGNR